MELIVTQSVSPEGLGCLGQGGIGMEDYGKDWRLGGIGLTYRSWA